jgi:hypothetical protein
MLLKFLRLFQAGVAMSQQQKEFQQTASQSHSITNVSVEEADPSLFVLTSTDVSAIGYYVIIGCGTAAVLNHTTLRQTQWGKQRIGDLPVMHIGFEDPWIHYHSHKMGQSRNLLTLPGYEKQYDPASEVGADQPRMSNLFAEETRHEQERLRAVYNFKVRRGFVALIQPSWETDILENIQQALNEEDIDTHLLYTDFEFATPYRLLVVGMDGKSQLVYASKIDICTGSGRPRVLKDLSETVRTKTVAAKGIGVSGLSDYELNGTKPWEPPEAWSRELRERRVICGAEALYEETVWESGKRVCVMGEGGIGVNMVERGEDVDAWLDWIAKEALSFSSFGNPRNHWLLKHPLVKAPGGQRMEPGEFQDWKNPEAMCDPAHKKWRFGRDSVISKVSEETADKLKIAYTAYDPVGKSSNSPLKEYYASGHPAPQVRDYYEEDRELDNECFPYSAKVMSDARPPVETEFYHRLVICSGQDATKVGQPRSITQMLILDPILAPGDLMVGMETKDVGNSIRVLGAASYTLREWANRPPSSGEQDHLSSLPLQAQFTGFTFCGMSIAHANHYFDHNPNTNLNTATQDEIEKQVGKVLANFIVGHRAVSPNGFTTREALEDMLKGILGRWYPTEWEEKIKKLTTTYRAPDPFWH